MGSKNKWKMSNLRTGYERQGELEAYWEVENDPIGDEYSPDETDAHELFYIWKKQVEGKYEGNLVPIFWYVRCGEQGKPEYMPFQYEHFKGLAKESFLSFFTEPINVETGEKLNWLTLPVVDKLRSAENGGQKGGFIQEATGWKPSMLQPFVYLPALTSAL